MNQLQLERDPTHCHRSILPHHTQEHWRQNCSRIFQTQSCIDLKWDYENRTFQANMDGYILELRNKYGHLTPKKPQYSPHKHRPIGYGATQKIVQPTYTSPPLNNRNIKRVQVLFGALLYVVRAVNNKLLVSLRAIGAQQASATEETAEVIGQLTDYVATYPDDGLIFRKSDMILSAHAEAGFLNESKARSRVGAHIFLSENDPKPKLNGPVLTIDQIIKNVMASSAEAEM